MTLVASVSGLKDLSAGERFDGTFLVQAKEVRVKRNGVPFLELSLGDRTGSIEARVWDNVEGLTKTFQANDLVRAQGRVQVFNNRYQAIVTRLRRLPEEQVRLGDFIPHTDRNIDAMYGDLLETVDELSNPDLRRLMSAIFRDPEVARQYRRSPAAKTKHHARIGGLLEHVTSMLQVARLLASHYTEMDQDILVCGVLLHDLGKIFELGSDRSFEYTDRGKLLGHIAMGSAWLDRKCDEIEGFPPRLKTLLLHLILSHHGRLEFGSPKVPLFREALVLHLIDDLDSKLEMIRQAEEGIVRGSVWSSFHQDLGRSVLLRDEFLRDREPEAAAIDGPPTSESSQPVSEDAPAKEPAQPEAPTEPAIDQDRQPLDAAVKDDQPASESEGPTPAPALSAVEDSAIQQAVPEIAEQPANRPERAGEADQAAPKPAKVKSSAVKASRPKRSSGLRTVPAARPAFPSQSPPLPNRIPPGPASEDPAL